MNFNLDPQVHHFHPADYVIFVATLVISLAIGFYYAFTGDRQRTVQEYLLGNRKMGILPIAMSLLASFISAIGIISTPAEVYMYGLGGSYIFIGTAIALPIVCSCYLPTFYNIGLTSINEYLELRFDKHIRRIASVIFLCHMTVYISFVLYAPALALSQVTGLPLWWSVAVVGILSTIYTALGGIKAVMWTDVFQISVVFIAICVVAFKGVFDLGGFSHMFSRAAEGKRLYFPSWSFDFRIRYTVWNLTIGSTVHRFCSYATNQIQVQRYLTSPSLQAAKRTILWNILGMLVFYTITGICGLNIYSKYWNCDPRAGNLVKAYDQMFPLFVMETLNNLPGLPGLFVAGVFCGSLSTLSSAFNSMAAISLEDIVKAFNKWKHLSPEKSAIVSKILAAMYGCLCLLTVAAISQSDSNIMQTARYNLDVFAGTTLGLFSLGLFFPWANRLGAYAGVILGFAFSFWVSINTQIKRRPFTPRAPYSVDGCEAMYGNNVTLNFTTEIPTTSTATAMTYSSYNTSVSAGSSEQGDEIFGLFQISFMWMPLLTSGSVVIIGILTSLLTGPTKLEHLDEKLLSPVIQGIVKKYRNKKAIEYSPSSVVPDEVNTHHFSPASVVNGVKSENELHI